MFDFPNSPILGQVYNGYTWDGEKWGVTFNAPNQGGVIAIKVFTASGTYTPSPNMTTCVIECVGGGGAGGGTVGNTGATQVGGGGGGGGYSRTATTAAVIGASQVVTIGAAGATGGTGAHNGGNGGTTGVGSLCMANGGGGGLFCQSAVQAGAGGPGATAGTGDLAVPGPKASMSIASSNITTIVVAGGDGANTLLGSGGAGSNYESNGLTGSGYGSGGGGSNSSNTTNSYGGAAGRPGLVVITEYGLTSLGSSTAASGAVRYDLPQTLTGTQQAQGRSNIAASPVLRGYIAGLTLVYIGVGASMQINAGVATDSTGANLMVLSSALVKDYSAWIVGAGGGLDTGAAAANTWYNEFLIKRPDTGVVDVCYSLSPTSPTFGVNIPAAYTLYRRIGAMKTGSSTWQPFTQNGDEFLWSVAVQDANNAAIGTSPLTPTLSVPPGVKVGVLTKVGIYNATTNGASLLVNSPDVASVAVGLERQVTAFTAGAAVIIAVPAIRTNTSAQVRAVADAAGSGYFISTYGWNDLRGKDA